MQFKEALKNFRKKLALSQLDFSKHLGFTQSCISFWERGRCYPNLNNLKKIIAFAKKKKFKFPNVLK